MQRYMVNGPDDARAHLLELLQGTAFVLRQVLPALDETPLAQTELAQHPQWLAIRDNLAAAHLLRLSEIQQARVLRVWRAVSLGITISGALYYNPFFTLCESMTGRGLQFKNASPSELMMDAEDWVRTQQVDPDLATVMYRCGIGSVHLLAVLTDTDIKKLRINDQNRKALTDLRDAFRQPQS